MSRVYDRAAKAGGVNNRGVWVRREIIWLPENDTGPNERMEKRLLVEFSGLLTGAWIFGNRMKKRLEQKRSGVYLLRIGRENGKMKRALIATLVFCVGTLAVMGQQSTAVNSSRSNIKNNSPVFSQGPDGKARCTVSGTACIKAQLEQFNTTLTTTNAAADQAKKTSSYTTTKSNVKTNAVRLGPDGSLLCETNDGKTQPCTAAHIADLNNAAAAMTIPKPVGPRDPAPVK